MFASGDSRTPARLLFLFAIVDIHSGRRLRMPIMNFAWPLTLLWSGPLGLWFYAMPGRARPATTRVGVTRPGHGPQGAQPTWIAVLLATPHCDAGCALGDLLAESLQARFAFSFLGRPVFAAWILDYALAFAFGILFQYFTIKPMKGLSPKAGFLTSFP